MNGSRVATSRVVGNMSNDWTVVEVGDFNGDGSSDIIWRNNVTGYAKTWWMNGAHINRVSTVPGNAPNTLIGTVDPRNPSTWTGVYMGGSVGSLGITNTFTNAGQFSLCPPLPALCIPDLTPSPVASASNSGVAGNVVVGYNQALPFAGDHGLRDVLRRRRLRRGHRPHSRYLRPGRHRADRGSGRR